MQGATSHMLGQNFGKIFGISFEDEEGKTAIPWQVKTRSVRFLLYYLQHKHQVSTPLSFRSRLSLTMFDLAVAVVFLS